MTRSLRLGVCLELLAATTCNVPEMLDFMAPDQQLAAGVCVPPS